jgi:glycosyltransferase involved in cell wall biosynthesis
VRRLRILVYPHAMEVGGSQLIAIELAAAVRDLGHEVIVFSENGPLVAQVEAFGLERIEVESKRRSPSPKVAARLHRLVRARGIDVIHGYEWPPGLEATAASLFSGWATAICTVLSMAVAPFLPASLPLIVGTEAIRQHTAARRSGPTYLIEPSVDVVENAPGFPVEEFRSRFGLDESISEGSQRPINIGVVSRLVANLKLEGILTAIDVVGKLATKWPVRLIIVGDGDARETAAARAREANARAGRRAVILTGELLDPRPAYAAADIMLGMGGSALRALAFGRPLVVQGERGFWSLLTPDTCDTFLRQGFYGLGDGTGGEERLTAILRQLLEVPGLRKDLGAYGRGFAVDRFSLQRAAKILEQIYLEEVATGASKGTIAWRLAEGVGCAARLTAYKARRRYQRMRGTAARDDFNATALAEKALKVLR